MREPNLGCYTSCVICGKRFWTEDGYAVCSPSCDRIFENESEEEEEDA